MKEHQNKQGDSLYVAIEKYTPKEGKMEKFIDSTKTVGTMLENIEGLLQYQVLKPTNENGAVVSTAVWQSKGDFDRFMKSDVIKELMTSDLGSNLQEMTKDASFDTYELVQGWHQ